MDRSRILIIGASGHIGPHIAHASIALNHPTFVLLRPDSAANPAKAELVQRFRAAGIVILYGSLEDYNSLLEAIRQVDVVISAVGRDQFLNQLKIISAIKEVGTIKRFLPSEFGFDLDKIELTQPLEIAFESKLKVRRALQEEGVPFTNIVSNGFAAFFLANLAQPDLKSPPTDKVIIYGDGNTKGVCVDEVDIGVYTIKTVDDPRTLNKTVHFRPPENIISQNEMVALWEAKTGRSLEKLFMSEQELLKLMEETPYPKKVSIALRHIIFVKGAHCGFPIGPDGAEISELYPEVKYTTASEYLDCFIQHKQQSSPTIH